MISKIKMIEESENHKKMKVIKIKIIK